MKINDLILSKEYSEEKFIQDLVTTTYVPELEKYELAKQIADACVEEDEGGFLYENIAIKRIITFYITIKKYTNIDLGTVDEAIESYDIIMENKKTPFGKVISNIHSVVPDSFDIELTSDNIICQKIESGNSLSSTVKKLFENLIGKVPSQEEMTELIEKTGEVFGSMSTKKLGNIAKIAEVVTPKPKQK